MAQKSKKIQIAEKALPIFLSNGIKGTSVDMVVKASGVSKPTVYNHFPDKSSLLKFVLELWIEQQPSAQLNAADSESLQPEISQRWLSNEALLWYGLFIGEGYRAEEAAAFFTEHFDLPWRQALGLWASKHSQSEEALQAQVSHQIVKAKLYPSQLNS